MKNKLSKFIFIILTILLIYYLKTNFSEYNTKKSISACVLGQKRTSTSFDLKEAQKYCEQEIKKKKEK